jgi:hypothetical protein
MTTQPCFVTTPPITIATAAVAAHPAPAQVGLHPPSLLAALSASPPTPSSSLACLVVAADSTRVGEDTNACGRRVAEDQDYIERLQSDLARWETRARLADERREDLKRKARQYAVQAEAHVSAIQSCYSLTEQEHVSVWYVIHSLQTKTRSYQSSVLLHYRMAP